MVEIYWIFSVVSSSILGLIVLLNIIGVDLDNIDFGFDGFSINSTIGFFCVGGWTGYLANLHTAFEQWVIFSIALLAGLSTYIGSLFILKRLRGLESSGNIQLDNAVGKIGKVYLGIPGKDQGEGQVEILVQGRLKVLTAISMREPIETGTKILVYDVIDNKLVVESYTE